MTQRLVLDPEQHLGIKTAYSRRAEPAAGKDQATHDLALGLANVAIGKLATAARRPRSIQHGLFHLAQGKILQHFGHVLSALHHAYEQFQFSESGKSSLAYWTLIGAYVINGEKNETRTMLYAAVYDIPSRAMLFNATGRSGVRGRSTPVDVSKQLRGRSEQGFRDAMDDLIVQLDQALDTFVEQAATGTVRGAGTPAIEITDATGAPVESGAGTAGPAEWIVVALLGSLAWRSRRRRR